MKAGREKRVRGGAVGEEMRGEKKPIDIDEMIKRLREEVKGFADAAMFELADRGFGSPFQQLVGCIISIRTLDEVSLVAALRLLERAGTAAAMAKLPVEEIDRLIGDSTFHEAKAAQISEIARRVEDEFGGELPCDYDTLVSFKGVGPKCASLTLGIACGQPRISVDIHVHRVTNRWGYVQASTPEKTMLELEGKLPKRYWIEINRLLVPFGKHICRGTLPKCSICPLLDMCRQIGVEAHR